MGWLSDWIEPLSTTLVPPPLPLLLLLPHSPLKCENVKCQKKKTQGSDKGLTICDEVLDPGKEALHSGVDAGGGVSASRAIAHHSDQGVLA